MITILSREQPYNFQTISFIVEKKTHHKNFYKFLDRSMNYRENIYYIDKQELTL